MDMINETEIVGINCIFFGKIMITKDVTETTNIERTYWYDINDKMVADHENMAAYLLDEGILGVTSAVDSYNGKECLGLCININDYLIPCSDAESVTYDELPILYELYKQRKYDGVAQFVADKRGVPNKHWRETYGQ